MQLLLAIQIKSTSILCMGRDGMRLLRLAMPSQFEYWLNICYVVGYVHGQVLEE